MMNKLFEGKLTILILYDSDSIWALNWSRGNLLTGSLDGSVKYWSNSLGLTSSGISHKIGVTSVVSSKDGSIGVASYQDGTIRLLNLPDLSEISVIEAGVLEAWTVCLSPSDDVLVSGSHHGSVNIWSMQAGHEKVATLQASDKLILGTSFSSDYKLATSGVEGMLHVFDMNTQQIVHKVDAHGLATRSVVFSPDGNLIYSASDDRHVCVFDTNSGSIINSFSQSGMAFSVDASPDGRSFAVGCGDHSVSVWDLGMQRRVHSFEQHSDCVWGVKYDPQDGLGKRFASVGDDALLQVYE